MHGLIFETSVWLLAESTRLLWFPGKTLQNPLQNHTDWLWNRDVAMLHLWIIATSLECTGWKSPCTIQAHMEKIRAGNLHTKAYINWLTLTALNTSKDSLQQQSTKGHTLFVTNNSDLSRREISIDIHRVWLSQAVNNYREMNCIIQLFSYRNN